MGGEQLLTSVEAEEAVALGLGAGVKLEEAGGETVASVLQTSQAGRISSHKRC